MSNTNFFGLSRDRYDPLANLSRPVVVPERPVEKPMAPPARRVHHGRAMDMVAKLESKPMPKPEPRQKPPEPKPEPKPEVKPTNPVISVDDLLNDFIDNKPKAKKIAKAKGLRPKLAHKLTTQRSAKTKVKAEVKTKAKVAPPQAPKTTPNTKKTNSNFTTQALTAAADTTKTMTTTTPASLVVNDSGEAAVENRLPRLSFELKINKRHLFAFLRTVIVLTILAASGYLAWDTWLVNKTLQGTVSSPVTAVAINETAPSGVDTTSISNQAWSAYTVPADQARYVYLPTVNARARVLSVGINSKGKIDAAKNVNDVAWYDGSAKPGQEGQVFINGHTAFASTYKAAFDDLPKLKAGDRIIIERGDGKQIYYRVTSSETINASQVDMKKILNVPDGAMKGLTLMSCTGKFNYRTQTSDKRVIVYAVQE